MATRNFFFQNFDDDYAPRYANSNSNIELFDIRPNSRDIATKWLRDIATKWLRNGYEWLRRVTNFDFKKLLRPLKTRYQKVLY